MYCGNDIIVQKAVQTHSGVNLEGYAKLARSAANGGNYSEAYSYYTKILEVEPENLEAWLGKADSAGWMSTLRDFRIAEMISGFEHAVEIAREDEKQRVLKEANRSMNSVSTAYYQLAKNHLLEFVALDNSWTEYLQQSGLLIAALENAHEYDQSDRVTMENIIFLCSDCIQGVKYNDPYDNNIQKVWFLSDQYEAELRKKMSKYAFKIRKLDPSYVLPEVKRQTPSNCFVATATMGNHEHPYVLELRNFRDLRLSHTWTGTIFIEFYYKIGPFLAKPLNKSLVLRKITCSVLIRPLSNVARWLSRRKTGEQAVAG